MHLRCVEACPRTCRRSWVTTDRCLPPRVNRLSDVLLILVCVRRSDTEYAFYALLSDEVQEHLVFTLTLHSMPARPMSHAAHGRPQVLGEPACDIPSGPNCGVPGNRPNFRPWAYRNVGILWCRGALAVSHETQRERYYSWLHRLAALAFNPVRGSLADNQAVHGLTESGQGGFAV